MDNIEEMISAEKIKNRVLELSKEISDYYQDNELYVICILKGSMLFTADLIRNITSPVILDFLIASSYKDKTYSDGNVEIIKDIDVDITNKNVLLVDDIVDTGYTLSYVVSELNKKNPNNIKICTLFDKPSRRETKVYPDFNGFTIENEFIVGYGLDYDNRYRNLKYVGKVKQLKKQKM